MIDLINLDKTGSFNLSISRGRDSLLYYNMSGVSSDNEYVPLFAPFVNKAVYNKKIIHYSLPKAASYRNTNIKPLRSYSKVYEALRVSTYPYNFKTTSMDFNVIVIKGALFLEIDQDNVELLFSIGVKRGYLKEMFRAKELDITKFAILVSHKFSSGAKFKSMYRKLYKEIIEPHLERGVDIITTNNIVGKCFSNNVQLPKFKRVSEVREYLHAFNSEI